MKMPQQFQAAEKSSLWHFISASADLSQKWIWSLDRSICLDRLTSNSAICTSLSSAQGRSILVRTESQLTAALALIELDGIARKLVLCPSDLPGPHLQWVVTAASVDLIICDQASADISALGIESVVLTPDSFTPIKHRPEGSEQTEWLLLTSGTTGLPKIVVHTLSTLTDAIAGRSSWVGMRSGAHSTTFAGMGAYRYS